MSHDETTTAHDAYLSRTYFPELDGLRAISVLLVISIHMYDANERWWWLAGYRGVTIFFVLSGYLITMLALREEARYGRLSLAAFYVRRTFRILPLYYVTLALYCLLILGLGVSAHLRGPLADALPYYLLYFQEVTAGCRWLGLTQVDLVFRQSWSLGVEEKFYLLWPLLAFVCWRGAGRRRLLGTAALMVGFAAAPTLLGPFGPLPRVVGRILFCYASLLTGCLLALLLHHRAAFHWLRQLRGATLPAALLLLAAHFATPWVAHPSLADGLNVLYTLAVGLFLATILVGDGPAQRLLRCWPLVRLGRLSYGIYLLHMLAMGLLYRLLPASSWHGLASILPFCLTALLSTALAWVMHRTVESFGINLGRRWSRRILERAATRALRPALPSPCRNENQAIGLTSPLSKLASSAITRQSHVHHQEALAE
ncbi:MAG: acyltransferase family protein [Gemmataceae bacterium]